MKQRNRKILVVVLAVFVGMPLMLILGGLGYGCAMDRTNGSLVSSDLTRRYLLYVPSSYDRSKPAPLVICFHPAATWPALIRNISRWNELADEKGFIVVYPAGTGVLLHGTGRGPQVWNSHTFPRDVRFVSDLIDRLQADYNLDPRRIYTSGMSNGGAMAFAVACALHGRIAAVGVAAPAGPPLPSQERFEEASPLPTVAFHGTADAIAPFAGGKSPVSPGRFPAIPEWIAAVAQMNGCEMHPVETRVSAGVGRVTFENRTNHADVVLYSIDGGGHTWPGGGHVSEWFCGRTSDEINATRVTWEFFAQHPRDLR